MRVLPHEEIISKLDRAGEMFRVLVIKTNMRIPYTSCFSNWTADIGMPSREAASGHGR